LDIIDGFAPDVRLLNLETSITADGEFARGKGVHYRMHPDNVGCLAAVRPDVCALANNHVLDFGYQGLTDTLRTLEGVGIHSAGAGLDLSTAERPAIAGHVVIVSCGMGSSGIPRAWAATGRRAGVAFVPDLTNRSADAVADRALAAKGSRDAAVVSVHWGSNWGYDVDAAQISFAHRLIDSGIDVVHGHSSHHTRPIEVYRGRLIMYGCGDTIDDYEGISSYESFRHELRLLYFASMDAESDTLLRMVPMRMRRMRLERAPADDADWLRASVTEMSSRFGTRIETAPDGVLAVPVA
jgi:poly-gamma-glutamate synthesis protein (capsule biosynthesis protein)